MGAVDEMVHKARRYKLPLAEPQTLQPLRRLDYVLAAGLADKPEPEDQLVEGLIGRKAMSILYGDSNSGKTFFAIDVGCAICSGAMWMGRHTVRGLVVYLATEAPQSVITRVQAYQLHYRRKVPHLVIVRSPVDLFGSAADASAVIELIQSLEAKHAMKCELVIGDTLARLAAGANENSGEDMSAVIRHADLIRREAETHVMLIHHSGKDQTRGARGWSGLRAAIDTEIEVTADNATGLHAAEITKQRDLAGKGSRIGFRLQILDLGAGQWKERRTSCVVVAAEAPIKQAKGRRPSEVAGAIAELLTQRGSSMRKADIVKHFAERYKGATVYRELKKMSGCGRLQETAGVIELIKPRSARPLNEQVPTSANDQISTNGEMVPTGAAPYRGAPIGTTEEFTEHRFSPTPRLTNSAGAFGDHRMQPPPDARREAMTTAGAPGDQERCSLPLGQEQVLCDQHDGKQNHEEA